MSTTVLTEAAQTGVERVERSLLLYDYPPVTRRRTHPDGATTFSWRIGPLSMLIQVDSDGHVDRSVNLDGKTISRERLE